MNLACIQTIAALARRDSIRSDRRLTALTAPDKQKPRLGLPGFSCRSALLGLLSAALLLATLAGLLVLLARLVALSALLLPGLLAALATLLLATLAGLLVLLAALLAALVLILSHVFSIEVLHDDSSPPHDPSFRTIAARARNGAPRRRLSLRHPIAKPNHNRRMTPWPRSRRNSTNCSTTR
jgi:hypothetical protein